MVCGTAKDSLFGACESFFRPNMVTGRAALVIPLPGQASGPPPDRGFILWMHQEPEDLFETVSQALLSSVDRDAMSGWGGVVYIM